jgi:hypothetical protein
MKGMYEVYCLDGFKWHDVLVYTTFHNDRLRYSSNIKSIISTIWEAVAFVLLMRRINLVSH